MAEFCSCGSLKIDGNCTNKNCINKVALKPGASKAARSKSAGTASKTAKAPKQESYQARTRRASKCITYNLYETNEPDENDGSNSVMDEDSDEE